jgi:hypothetical protein
MLNQKAIALKDMVPGNLGSTLSQEVIVTFCAYVPKRFPYSLEVGQ